jgi:poly-gamma-glutamate capsule biosynthesis protein CapA/YwtB (metallophosphatase superfamily)
MALFLARMAFSVLPIGFAFSVAPLTLEDIPHKVDVAHVEVVFPPTEPIELFFVGDIMLGRAVESRMEIDGLQYPFLYTESLLSVPDISIGNFEGVVTSEHMHAPSMTFQFSIRDSYLRHLEAVGFDVLSIANNHSADYGEGETNYMRTRCNELTLRCIGDAKSFGPNSVLVRTVNDVDIAFVALHTTWGTLDVVAVTDAIHALSSTTDMQVAYVHWGDEYVLTHNESQQKLAEQLIDAGADAVIGHHPHVVQDVALYKGKPIFYSLGNFIFDQYFSQDVQEGMGVRMKIYVDHVVYTLVPFTSIDSRNQPREMQEGGRARLLARVLSPIEGYPVADVPAGSIAVPR